MKKIVARAEAMRDLKTVYFTGKPCRYGHISERYTKNSICKVCAKLAVEKSRKEYSDRLKAAGL